MNLQLIATLLLTAGLLAAVSGIAYYVMLRIKERQASNHLAREMDDTVVLKRYESELRDLEIKARTKGYESGDSERYARLIYRRNALLKRAQHGHPVLA